MTVALLDRKDDRTYEAEQQMNALYPGRAIAYDVDLKDASGVESAIKGSRSARADQGRIRECRR